MDQEIEIASDPTRCAVCKISLEGLGEVISRKHMNQLFSFCSEECAQDFMNNPESFLENEEEEAEE